MPEDDRVPEALPAGDNQDIKPYVEQVIEIVSSWTGVMTGEGRFNATTFSVGQREIGHIHPHQWGLVDISYPQPLREQLLVEGHTEKHHVVPNRATTFAIKSEDDIKQPVFLLRLSYLHHVNVLEQMSDIEEQIENIDLDVEAEIRQLKLSDELHAVLTRSSIPSKSDSSYGDRSVTSLCRNTDSMSEQRRGLTPMLPEIWGEHLLAASTLSSRTANEESGQPVHEACHHPSQSCVRVS